MTCIKKEIDGNWLTKGRLEICILKLNTPTKNQYDNDESRPDNLSIITNLLQKIPDDKSFLEKEGGKPTLILAPELSFGSQDYKSLNDLVVQCAQNLILIAGFGFVKGDVLNSLSKNPNVEGIWNNAPESADKKYNGGWAWVKEGKNIKCYIFLKNFFSQSGETSISDLVEGDCILQLEADDVIIFPLICAELFASEDGSPRERIKESLGKSGNKKVLITGSLLNEKSSSIAWINGIGDLLTPIKKSDPILLLSNCVNPPYLRNEDDDKWRCLSGVFRNLGENKPPKEPLPYIRYVNHTNFLGFVLRNYMTSCVFAKLSWGSNPTESLNILSTPHQYVWDGKKFKTAGGDCDADELYRFIQRYKGQTYYTKNNSNRQVGIITKQELEDVISQLAPGSDSSIRKVAGLLSRRCLKGIENEAVFNPDHLHKEADNLNTAITILVLIKSVIGAELMPSEKDLNYGQLLHTIENAEHEFLVWNSSQYSPRELHNIALKNVVNLSGSARPLTIFGRGKSFGEYPPNGRIKSDRYADFSNPSPDSKNEKNISEAGDRVVFWKNQSIIDEILSSDAEGRNIIEDLKNKINFEKKV
ncbi:MAG: hypothetical protein ACJAT4_000005 [Granulosicoccus sp.]|jgi:hypothetical protein